jgi:hypothetical protein
LFGGVNKPRPTPPAAAAEAARRPGHQTPGYLTEILHP